MSQIIDFIFNVIVKRDWPTRNVNSILFYLHRFTNNPWEKKLISITLSGFFGVMANKLTAIYSVACKKKKKAGNHVCVRRLFTELNLIYFES